MDVITLHQAGFANAVATLGTALTPEQARLISQYADEVVVADDSDQAGRQAALRAVELFDQLWRAPAGALLKGRQGPDEYIKKFGAKRRFHDAGAKPGGRWSLSWSVLRQRHDIQTDEGKIAFYQGLLRNVGRTAKYPIEAGCLPVPGGAGAVVWTSRRWAGGGAVRRRRERKQQQAERRDLRPFTEFQPGRPRDPQRSRHPGCVVAEDGTVWAACQKPGLLRTYYGGASHRSNLFTEHNRALYSAVCQRLEDCKPRGHHRDGLPAGYGADGKTFADRQRGAGAQPYAQGGGRLYRGHPVLAEQPTTSQLAAMNVLGLDAFAKKISAGKKK